MTTPFECPSEGNLQLRSDADLARRDFLFRSVVAGTAVATGGFGATRYAQAGVAGRGGLGDLACDDFRALIGEEFAMAKANGYEGEPFKLVVQDVTDLRRASDSERPAGVRRSGFVVQFTAPSGSVPRDGIYELTHPAFAPTRLFLQPTTAMESPFGELRCLAVFN